MTRTYDFKKCILIIGAFQMKGFAPGTAIAAERDEAAWDKKVGADGEVTRSKSNNKAGKVTITLDQASPSNDILSAIAVADELTNEGVVPVLLKDLSGTTLVAASAGWVQKQANAQLSKKSEDRTWVIDTGEMDTFIGGNGS